MSNNNEDEEKISSIETLVGDCIKTHNEAIIVHLIFRLEKEYRELATLSTYGEYDTGWTHLEVMNYTTYET